jgi:hypothetical protein
MSFPRPLGSALMFACASFASAFAAGNPLPPPQATEQWSPESPVVAAPAGGVPSDAIVLFDGTDLDAWESAKGDGAPARWKIEGDALTILPRSGGIRTKRSFGDVQLHVEFRTPKEIKGDGQNRGNSGVFLMGRYEVQVLDSHGNKTYVNGQAASIYKQHPPLVNASRPPGEWQSYDIIWIAPRFDPDGKVLSPARVTVFHNGVLVQHDVALKGPTIYRGLPAYTPHADKLPLELQDHGEPVSYRNIWARELALPSP